MVIPELYQVHRLHLLTCWLTAKVLSLSFSLSPSQLLCGQSLGAKTDFSTVLAAAQSLPDVWELRGCGSEKCWNGDYSVCLMQVSAAHPIVSIFSPPSRKEGLCWGRKGRSVEGGAMERYGTRKSLYKTAIRNVFLFIASITGHRLLFK